ncbi:hypothetical protein BJP36_36460 [Moorena producens JHB]|uniref:Uncharacterized protein n=1 Tax=Moorena producens (strain JHB) TaxID=1454205 RepID=A0A9Q9STY7_MOOP1|nr:hypothetical protein [Moorena producens]WAN69583.1 hypothetical protein BJP36_36460 [Moorena producens JHB]
MTIKLLLITWISWDGLGGIKRQTVVECHSTPKSTPKSTPGNTTGTITREKGRAESM